MPAQRPRPGRGACGEAVARVHDRQDLDPQTLRSYGQTLRRLCLALGEQTPLHSVSGEQVTRVLTTAWGRAAARTWNRHLSAIRSFTAWAGLDDLTAGLRRRPETSSPAGPIGPAELDPLWSRTDLPLRERTLWRMLHESAAPAHADLCPHTGRRRLSYERAEYLFKQATKHLDPSGNGYTLRRLKPRDPLEAAI